jgi:hypothetical protein
MEKYIEGVKSCKSTVAWIVTKDQIEDIVMAIKTKCPGFSHNVTLDWDDESLLWLRFTREVVVPKPAVPVIPSVKPKPVERYGGPRW